MSIQGLQTIRSNFQNERLDQSLKYMGSKLQLLNGRLGDTLLEMASEGERFIDLFAGSATVSHFVAQEVQIPVLSNDLQTFSSALALSVTGRTSKFNSALLLNTWILAARRGFEGDSRLAEAILHSHARSRLSVEKARKLCVRESYRKSPLWRDYGGHYFSPVQSLAMDHLLKRLPSKPAALNIALAALLRTASACAAAPGHTAQPFQPTPSLLPFIRDAWSRDVFENCEREVLSISMKFAKVRGRAMVKDGVQLTEKLNSGDVVFCDPPYSNAQYSRFYHVLEGIALGGWESVSGAGRAPERNFRATSDFSNISSAPFAFEQLFHGIANAGASAIITFPSGQASNGMTGGDLQRLARKEFVVKTFQVRHTHSTLGGPSERVDTRGSRRELQELVLVLRPELR